MKKIQVLATRPYHHPFPIISWLIRLLEWTKQSHVVLFFPDKEVIRHAHFNDIREEKVESFMERNRLVGMKTISISDDQYQKIDEYSLSRLGKQKGYFCTLFGQIIPQLAKTIFELRLKNPFHKGTTCSEYVQASLYHVDEILVYSLTKHIHPGTFSTKDALQLASALSEQY